MNAPAPRRPRSRGFDSVFNLGQLWAMLVIASPRNPCNATPCRIGRGAGIMLLSGAALADLLVAAMVFGR